MPEIPVHTRLRSGLLLATLVPSFYLAEWLLVGASAGLFAWLRHQGVATGRIWLLLWLGNLALSAGLVRCNDLLRVDITLMQGLRRLTDAAIRHRRRSGLLLEAVICGRLLLWDGPCQLLIYLRRRLPRRDLRLALLVVASALQMGVWALLYDLGYDGLGDLLRHWKGV